MMAVKGIEKRWYEIGRWLYIPYETRQEMRIQHSTDMDRLKAVFLYVLTLHPYASWRCFISVFRRIGAHQIAARLSEYSEPVTGAYNKLNLSVHRIIQFVRQHFQVVVTTS